MQDLVTFLATLRDRAVGLQHALAIEVPNAPEGISIAAPISCATGFAILRPFLHDPALGWVFGVAIDHRVGCK